MARQIDEHVEIVDLIGASDEELTRISREGMLALNLDEMRVIRAYFVDLDRNPTDVEIETLAQTWSEHCKHKVFNGVIEYTSNDGTELIDNLFNQTIRRATEDVRKEKGSDDWCVSVFVDNAGIIRFDDKHNVVFKVETHNHPSALDPYGGANTGIGGVLRDALGTGLGAKPILNTDIFCFAPPDYAYEDLPSGVLHPKRILKGVVAGVRDYGNRMGIPTVNGAICFDKRYLGNPLVYCGTAGVIPSEFCEKEVSPGDLIVSLGGKTGRDGIHGATFSSIELDDTSESSASQAVQIGNAIEEKKVLDVILQARDLSLFSSITDCGAGGFSSAIGEMGEGTGAIVYLEKAPLKYGGLKPWEIFLSESQERMVLSVPPAHIEALLNLCAREDVEATVIGEFTDDNRLTVTYRGESRVTDRETVANLDMHFLHKGVPRVIRKAVWHAPEHSEPKDAETGDLTGRLLELMAAWNIASKEWVIRQYDHEVQGGSVLKPLQGITNDGPGDAAVVRPVLTSDGGVAVSNGINPCYGDIDPYWMAASAIDEALRQITSIGGRVEDTALLDNFCWGNPDKPDRLGALVRAARACYDMATAFETPYISGKDSFYNEFSDGSQTIAIPPTLLISAICVLKDASKVVSMDAKEAGSSVYLVGSTANELGGSQYYRTLGYVGNAVPKVDAVLSRRTMSAMHAAIDKGLVAACHDCSEGGLGVAAAELAFSGGLGLSLDLRSIARSEDVRDSASALFSESNGRFLVEIKPGRESDFESSLSGIPHSKCGTLTLESAFRVTGLDAAVVVETDIDTLKNAWQAPLIF